MRILIENRELEHTTTQDVRIRRGINQVPVLTVHFLVSERISTRKLPGKKLTCEISGSVRFGGFIYRASYEGNLLEIEAWAAIGRLNLAPKTFAYGGGPTPTPLGHLEGIDRLFADVTGRELLTDSVELLFQHQESDWQMLQRMAMLSQIWLVADSVRPTARFCRPIDSQIRRYSEEEVLKPPTEESQLTVEAVQCRTFDSRTGELPASVAGCQRQALEEEAHSLNNWATASVYSAYDGVQRSDRQKARAYLAAESASRTKWIAELSNLEIDAGDRIESFEGEVRYVMSSELSFDMTRPVGFQLRNSIFGTECSVPPKEHGPPQHQPSFDLLYAQVSDVNDPAGMGRVKVSFPWHNRPSQEPSAWQGIWARVRHRSAGRTVARKRRGTLELPGLLNWGIVTFCPGSCQSPFFDPIYCGSESVPESSGQPSAEQLLFDLPGGAVFLVGHGTQGKMMLAIRRDDGSDACGIVLNADGTIEIKGRVRACR